VRILDGRIGEPGISSYRYPQDIGCRTRLGLPNLRRAPAPPLATRKVEDPDPFSAVGGTRQASAGEHLGIIRMGEHGEYVKSFDQCLVLGFRS